jgi:hypothetical protein
MMVRFQLGELAEETVGKGELPEMAFNLIEWAEKKDKIYVLIKAALDANPGNLVLRAFADQILPTVA